MKLELFYPVKPYKITQSFGVNGKYYRDNGINIIGHNGQDVKTGHGQNVYAAHDGTVVYAGVDGGEGYGVVVKTNEKFSYKRKTCHFKTIYWHLLPNFKVHFRDKVKAGDLLGYADNTGFSTGDHLHFALKPVKQGKEEWSFSNLEQDNGYLGAINPRTYFGNLHAQDIKRYISVSKLLIKALERLLEVIKRA